MRKCPVSSVVVVATTVPSRANSTGAPATGRFGHGESIRCGPGQPGDAVTVPVTTIPDSLGVGAPPVFWAQPASAITPMTTAMRTYVSVVDGAWSVVRVHTAPLGVSIDTVGWFICPSSVSAADATFDLPVVPTVPRSD